MQSVDIQRFSVLAPEECESIVERATPRLSRSTVTGGPEKRLTSAVRTSYECELLAEDFPGDTLPRVLETLTRVTGKQPGHVEQFRALRYEVHQHYSPHHDWFGAGYAHKISELEGGQRIYSAVLCLCEPELGGELVFPLLGLSEKPRLGSMVVWNNTVGGEGLQQAMHGSDPVKAGIKWSLVTWVRESPRKGGRARG